MPNWIWRNIRPQWSLSRVGCERTRNWFTYPTSYTSSLYPAECWYICGESNFDRHCLISDVRSACSRFVPISFIVAEKTPKTHEARSDTMLEAQVLNGNKINNIFSGWGTEVACDYARRKNVLVWRRQASISRRHPKIESPNSMCDNKSSFICLLPVIFSMWCIWRRQSTHARAATHGNICANTCQLLLWFSMWFPFVLI